MADSQTVEGSAELIPVEERDLRGLELAERHFPPERREQVAQFLEVPPESPALLPYLAWCASNGFSPIAGHVWLIPRKIRGSDGEVERTIYKPAVGRDGLLHRARNTPTFEDLDFGVVCERDTFEAKRHPKTREWTVLHEFASKPTVFEEGEQPDRWRGKVMGAWAILYLKGRRPTYYYAELREHGRLRQVWQYSPQARKRVPVYLDAEGKPTFAEFGEGGIKNRPKQEWDGAWDYLSTMILKAAQSYVLRIGLGITGVVPVDELRDPRQWSEPDAPDAGPVFLPPDEIDLKEMLPENDAEVVERLQEVVDQANDQEAFAWGAAKCEMVFTGRTDDELRERIEQIGRENELRAEQKEKAEEERIEEAEVVEDSPEVAALKTQLETAQRELGNAEEGSEEEATLRAEIDQLTARVRDATGGERG